MEKIRPRFLPALSIISDFHEVNLRTYVTNNNKKGVYFLSIEAQKILSAFIAKTSSGLPYKKSVIKRTAQGYSSRNKITRFSLDVVFEIGEALKSKSEIDKWLTERYCLYIDDNKKIYRYDIHHKEWPLKEVKIQQLKLNYVVGDLNLSKIQPHLIHYSDGVKIVAWPKTILIAGNNLPTQQL